MSNQFEKLSSLTTIVADTGDIDQIKILKPTDATTNPSLILKAAKLPQYEKIVNSAISKAKESTTLTTLDEKVEYALDLCAVSFGAEILKYIPGVVSTEVDARLSYDIQGTINKARKIINLYQEHFNISKDQVLIKIASTWEGIQAAKILEQEGIHCNLTLLFSFIQAIACAEAKVTLISPFVGRIRDWYLKQDSSRTEFKANEDPGVLSVTKHI